MVVSGMDIKTRLAGRQAANTLCYPKQEPNFEIFGLKDLLWELFEAGNDYEAFLIRRK